MKKKVLATASVLALVSGAQADSNFKSGFKVGGGVGYKHHRLKSQSNYDPTLVGIGNGLEDENFSKSASDNTVAFQLHAGYDWIISRFLAALEFDCRYSPDEVKMTLNTNQHVLGPEEAPYNVHQQHSHDFGLSGRLGALVTSNFALYAIGNVRLGQFKHKFINSKQNEFDLLLLSNSKSRYLWGFGGGIGARYAFSKGFSLAFEATYDVYQKIKFSENQNVALIGNIANFSTQSKRPRIFTALFKISKTF
jgi:opacity protein-like surface antigen